MAATDSSGQYQSSQAFAHILPQKSESVNPNTGSLNFTKSLVELRGITKALDLNLELTYSANRNGTFGLPLDWGFSLPYVIPGLSVTFRGRTYAIDLAWMNDRGHKSGLRYVNNHGVSFSPIVPPQPLPSGLQGQYSYRLKHTDGAVDYFDIYGRPVAHVSIHGDTIYYRHLPSHTQAVTSSQPCLDYIIDSWGQKIAFQYFPGRQVNVLLPNGSKTSVEYGSQGVARITDPMGHQTLITYTPLSQSQQVLTQITYPTGLQSVFTYKPMPYFDRNRQTRHTPAVENYVRRSIEGEKLEHTQYAYGWNTGGSTFTGIIKGYKMEGLRDSLIDSGDLTYRYDVTQTSLEDGKKLAAIRTTFNYLHLPVEEVKFLAVDKDNLREAYRTVNTYLINPDQHARAPSYAQPLTIEKFHNTAIPAGTSWRSLSRVSKKYNEYTNVVSEREEMNTFDKLWQDQRSTLNTYFSTVFGVQILTSQTVVDHISGLKCVSQNMLTKDYRGIESKTQHYAANKNEPLLPWQFQEYEYDDSGRITNFKLSWAPGVKAPELGPGSTSKSTKYTYKDGRLSESVKDSLGRITTSTYDMRLPGGPLVASTLPGGQSETLEYDIIGRKVKHTDAMGTETRIEYRVGKSANSQKETDATGYITLSIFDPLGRLIETRDNGDPTLPIASDPTRVTGRLKYDARGRTIESVDQATLKTSRTWDSLDRPLAVVDPDNNTSECRYDDAKLTVTNYVNGERRSTSWLDGDNKVLQTVRFPDSGDTSIKFCIKSNTTWSGHKCRIAEVTSEASIMDPESEAAHELKSETKMYDPNSNVTQHTVRGRGDKGTDTIKRLYSLDLFGNAQSYIKTITYADSRSYTKQGPLRVYNAANEFITLRNQLGQEEKYEYDENGLLSRIVRHDGANVSYKRDKAGRIIIMDNSDLQTQMSYDSRGRIIRMQSRQDWIKYQYSLDGSLTATDFSDGRSQCDSYDRFSRLVRSVDVFGVARATEYDLQGRVASFSYRSDRVTYSYGTVNHKSGQLLETQVTGDRSWGYSQTYSYDGFDALKLVAARDIGGPSLIDFSYLRNSRGQLISSSVNSTLGPAVSNKHRNWSYDGLGQMTEEVTFTTSGKSTQQFVYDGNANIIRITNDGQETNMAYNEIDQRTDSGFLYDTNGRLVRDNRGRTYTYDARDLLTSVDVGTGKSSFTFSADDFLKSCSGPQGSERLYHKNGDVQAMDVTDARGGEQVSMLVDHTSTMISACSSSGESTYYLHDRDSVAIAMQQDESTAMSYRAYGEVTIEQGKAPTMTQCAGYNGEFTDQLSGLIYLRSRFYDPGLMTFLTCDAHQLENRYAYCQGDPINNMDPWGHDMWTWIGMAVAFVASIAATIVTVGAATPTVAVVTGAATAEAAATAATAATATLAAAQNAVVAAASSGSLAVYAAEVASIGPQLEMSLAAAEVALSETVQTVAEGIGGAVGGVVGYVADGLVQAAGRGTEYNFDPIEGVIAAISGGAGGVVKGGLGRVGNTLNHGSIKSKAAGSLTKYLTKKAMQSLTGLAPVALSLEFGDGDGRAADQQLSALANFAAPSVDSTSSSSNPNSKYGTRQQAVGKSAVLGYELILGSNYGALGVRSRNAYFS